jgi:hypothetical protein
VDYRVFVEMSLIAQYGQGLAGSVAPISVMIQPRPFSGRHRYEKVENELEWQRRRCLGGNWSMEELFEDDSRFVCSSRRDVVGTRLIRTRSWLSPESCSVCVADNSNGVKDSQRQQYASVSTTWGASAWPNQTTTSPIYVPMATTSELETKTPTTIPEESEPEESKQEVPRRNDAKLKMGNVSGNAAFAALGGLLIWAALEMVFI